MCINYPQNSILREFAQKRWTAKPKLSVSTVSVSLCHSLCVVDLHLTYIDAFGHLFCKQLHSILTDIYLEKIAMLARIALPFVDRF